MDVVWLLLTWLGASLMTFMVLKPTTPWKSGRLAAISAIVPPIGVTTYLVASWILSQVFHTLTATMSFLVPGTAATAILALLLSALGMRTRSWLHFGVMIAVLFVASFGPFLALVQIASKAIRPGW